MSYNISDLKLVINPANRTRTIFTEYFYRRLLMATISSTKSNGSDTFSSFKIHNNDLQKENDGSNSLPTGLYPPISNRIDWTKYPPSSLYNHNLTEPFNDNIHYPIGCNVNSTNLIYNFPMFYKIIYGMIPDPNATDSYYNINNIYGSTSYNYYDTSTNKYNPWFCYGSEINQFILFNPPSWHTNPTGRNSSNPNILNAVPWGNLVVAPSRINIELYIEPYNNNKIQMKLTTQLNIADIFDTSEKFIINNSYYLTSMAIVDYDFQPLVLSTFPIIALNSSLTIQDELLLDFGATLFQPV